MHVSDIVSNSFTTSVESTKSFVFDSIAIFYAEYLNSPPKHSDSRLWFDGEFLFLSWKNNWYDITSVLINGTSLVIKNDILTLTNGIWL